MHQSNPKIKFFKDGNINWDAEEVRKMVTESRVKKISEYSKKRLDKLQKLNLVQGTKDPNDSDDDCFGHIFQVSDKVDVK